MRLVHVSKLHRFSYLKCSRVRLFQSHDHLEERCLSRAVRSYHTHYARGWKREAQVLEKNLVAISLRDVVSLDDDSPETRSRRNEQLQSFFPFLRVFVQKLIVRCDPRLRLRMPSLG